MVRGVAIAGIGPLVALVAIGCGDNGDETTASTTSTTALTKQEFVRDANKICKSSDDKIERAASQFFANAAPNKEPPPAELEKFGNQTVFPTIQAEIDRIRALGAPEGEEDEVNAILEAAESGLEGLKQDPKQIAKGGAAPAFDQAQKLAGDYGLDECAGG